MPPIVLTDDDGDNITLVDTDTPDISLVDINTPDITVINDGPFVVTDYSQLTNKPVLATVATTGSYNDLLNKPASGVGDKYYTTDFTSLSTIPVTHNLNKKPAVSLIDTAGDVFQGEVKFVDLNNLTIYLNYPTSGTVTCN